MSYTHSDLLAAVDKAWVATDRTCLDRRHPPGCCCDVTADAHLDTLRAILDLAALWDDQRADYPQHRSEGRYAAAAVGLCADEVRAQVADALRMMGVL